MKLLSLRVMLTALLIASASAPTYSMPSSNLKREAWIFGFSAAFMGLGALMAMDTWDEYKNGLHQRLRQRKHDAESLKQEMRNFPDFCALEDQIARGNAIQRYSQGVRANEATAAAIQQKQANYDTLKNRAIKLESSATPIHTLGAWMYTGVQSLTSCFMVYLGYRILTQPRA